MDNKFANFQNSINRMRLKVINAKGELVKGLSEPVVANDKPLNKKQIKPKEKDL